MIEPAEAYAPNQLVADIVVTYAEESSKLFITGDGTWGHLLAVLDEHSGGESDWSGDQPSVLLVPGQLVASAESTSRMSDNMTTPMIEARGLSKFYGDFAAARDISFEVQKGEIVAFLGPNGAGKSTTMKMLTGYLAPSTGSAHIAGHDMAVDRLAGARKLGYLPESGPLYPDMTPAALLDFFAEARGLAEKKKKERIEAVVDVCDLSTVYYKPIGKLSKGFRQRVGMAQALLHEPEVLIMDEPTAGLDPNQTTEVRETMLRLGKEKTILLSTHILQEVEAMATRAIVVNEGAKVADGPIEDFQQDDKSLASEFRRLTTGVAT